MLLPFVLITFPLFGNFEDTDNQFDAKVPVPAVDLKSIPDLELWLLDSLYNSGPIWQEEVRARGYSLVNELIKSNRPDEILKILNEPDKNSNIADAAVTALASYYYRSQEKQMMSDEFLQKSAESIVHLALKTKNKVVIGNAYTYFSRKPADFLISATIKALKNPETTAEDRLFLLEGSKIIDYCYSWERADILVPLLKEISLPLLVIQPERWDSAMRYKMHSLMKPSTAEMKSVSDEAFFQLNLVRSALESDEGKLWSGLYFLSPLTPSERAVALKTALESSYDRLRFLADELTRRESDDVFNELLKLYPNDFEKGHPLFEAFFARKSLSGGEVEIIRNWMKDPQGKPLLGVYQNLGIWKESALPLLKDFLNSNESDYKKEKSRALATMLRGLPLRKIWKEQSLSLQEMTRVISLLSIDEETPSSETTKEILYLMEKPEGFYDLKKERAFFEYCLQYLNRKFSDFNETEVTETLKISKIAFELESSATLDEILLPLVQKLDQKLNSGSDIRVPELKKMISEMK